MALSVSLSSPRSVSRTHAMDDPFLTLRTAALRSGRKHCTFRFPEGQREHGTGSTLFSRGFSGGRGNWRSPLASGDQKRVSHSACAWGTMGVVVPGTRVQSSREKSWSPVSAGKLLAQGNRCGVAAWVALFCYFFWVRPCSFCLPSGAFNLFHTWGFPLYKLPSHADPFYNSKLAPTDLKFLVSAIFLTPRPWNPPSSFFLP